MERDQVSHLAPEQALRDIRGIMERSAKFISLSGWSGVWAGGTAICSALIADRLIRHRLITADTSLNARPAAGYMSHVLNDLPWKLSALGAVTFLVAFAGAYFFTWTKARNQNQKIWNSTSRKLMWAVMIPMLAGGAFCLAFLNGFALQFIVPACLAFYGLGLINGSKYTLGEIRWLGYSEVALGLICLIAPFGYGLYFMAGGFGLLHILYGIFMWNKYDKRTAA